MKSRTLALLIGSTLSSAAVAQPPARSVGAEPFAAPAQAKTRVIVTSDGEIDDECSMVRFLLYANEWDIEGIVTSSSQYHWRGHKWAGDDWMDPYLAAYAQVYPNLVKHDPGFPSPAISPRTDGSWECGCRRGDGQSHRGVAADRQRPSGREGPASNLDSGVGRHQHHCARPQDHRGRPSATGWPRSRRKCGCS